MHQYTNLSSLLASPFCAQARSKKGAAAVQLLHDYSIHHVMLDEVATYVGPDLEDE